MRNQKIFRFLWVATLVLVATLSCETITGPIREAQEIIEVKNTAESIATDFAPIITQIDVEGIATDIQGIVTESGDMIATVQSAVTEMPDLSGEKPEDIPVMEGATEMITTSGFISYSTTSDLQTVVDFYDRGMTANGWSRLEADSRVEEEEAELVYQKGSRKATVTIFTIPFIEQTNVTIVIEE